MQAIYKALVNGGIDDQRSDSEASEDENENEVKKVDWEEPTLNHSWVACYVIVPILSACNMCANKIDEVAYQFSDWFDATGRNGTFINTIMLFSLLFFALLVSVS